MATAAAAAAGGFRSGTRKDGHAGARCRKRSGVGVFEGNDASDLGRLCDAQATGSLEKNVGRRLAM